MSGMPDSNRRPPQPECGALAIWANPRNNFQFTIFNFQFYSYLLLYSSSKTSPSISFLFLFSLVPPEFPTFLINSFRT